MRSAAHEAGAEDGIRFAFFDGAQEQRIFLRVILEVGVLDDNHIAGDGSETGAQGSTFALVDFVVDNLIHQRSDFRAKKVAGAVSGAVVHDDDFFIGNGCGAHGVHDFSDGADFVVTGDDDGDFHAYEVKLRWGSGARAGSVKSCVWLLDRLLRGRAGFGEWLKPNTKWLSIGKDGLSPWCWLGPWPSVSGLWR